MNTVALENPRWGQLGCSGFIVLDPSGTVVCDKTLAFLEYQEKAFENLLEILLITRSASSSKDAIENVQSLETVAESPPTSCSTENNCSTSGGG